MDYNSHAPNRTVDENGLIFTTSSLYEYLGDITDIGKPRASAIPWRPCCWS